MDELEYVEDQASRSMQFHLDNLDYLIKHTNALATLLLGLTGASFGYLIRLIESGAPPVALVGGTIVLTGYLAYLAGYVVVVCSRHADIMPPANMPNNLRVPEGYDLAEIRRFELENLQIRIEQNLSRANKLGAQMNEIKLYVVLAPAVFGVAYILLAIVT